MNTSTTNQANPYAPPKAFVQDVVDQNAPLELAGRGTRLAAAIIDGIMWGVAVYAPLVTGGIIDVERVRFAPEAVPVTSWIITLAAIVVLGTINAILVSRNGQSIAKKMFGIKVIRKDGSRATLGRIFWLRNVVSNLPGMILGALWSIADAVTIFGERRQCIHDKIADTIVVKA